MTVKRGEGISFMAVLAVLATLTFLTGYYYGKRGAPEVLRWHHFVPQENHYQRMQRIQRGSAV